MRNCFFGICSLLIFSLLHAQNVTNVEFVQKGSQIEISYRLDKKANIVVAMSEDGGESFSRITKVSGDVGYKVTAGDKKAVWDVLAEQEWLESDSIMFKVKASKPVKSKKTMNGDYSMSLHPRMANGLKVRNYDKKTFFEANLMWSPQPQQAYGITVGQVKRLGWYLSLLSNMNFKGTSTKLECNSKGFINNKLPFYSGNKSTTRISVTVGAIGKLFPFLALYAGVGFGYRALFWETIDKQWVKNAEHSSGGIDVDGGVLFDIKGFTISAGIVTTNYERIDFKVGIGFAINNKTKTNIK